MDFPVLYKKTSTGAIQFWEIKTVPQHISSGEASIIVTRFGQVDGKVQETKDLIAEGKNIGKKNETNAYQQADAEALAKWEKQKKKGYVETIEAAQAGEVDELIEGGINPMLAQPFSKHAQKIKYPCFAQPKLDGHRCIAIIENGKCTLWSRTRKRINSVPHIVAELERMFPVEGFGQGKIILDGELYNHEYRSNFEELTSLIRQEEPAEGHEKVQYHIYDQVSDRTFDDRWTGLELLFADGISYIGLDGEGKEINFAGFTYCKLVPTFGVFNDENVTELFSRMTEAGYEGVMLRNGDGLYVNKRSYDLQKVKEFQDEEFDIVGVEEGRGKLAGHVGAFKCTTKDGKEFLAKMSGSLDNLKRFFDDESLWRGKKLTVQFQGVTGANGVPRFPVGLRIREDI